MGARVPYFPSEVGIRIPCFPIASRKWELEPSILPQKWEPGYPVFEESGSQGTLFDGSERKVGIRAPYFSSGSGSQGTLFDRSKTYVQGNQVLHRRENIDLDHGIGHSSSLFGKLNVQASDT